MTRHAILSLGDLHGLRALFVVIAHMIDSHLTENARISRVSQGFKSSESGVTFCIAGSSHRSQESGWRITDIPPWAGIPLQWFL